MLGKQQLECTQCASRPINQNAHAHYIETEIEITKSTQIFTGCDTFFNLKFAIVFVFVFIFVVGAVC